MCLCCKVFRQGRSVFACLLLVWHRFQGCCQAVEGEGGADCLLVWQRVGECHFLSCFHFFHGIDRQEHVGHASFRDAARIREVCGIFVVDSDAQRDQEYNPEWNQYLQRRSCGVALRANFCDKRDVFIIVYGFLVQNALLPILLTQASLVPGTERLFRYFRGLFCILCCRRKRVKDGENGAGKKSCACVFWSHCVWLSS